MIGFVLSLLGGAWGRVKLWALAALGAAAFLTTVYFQIRRDARGDLARKNLEETTRRVEKGSKGAQQARAAQDQGRTPEDGVRSRDGDWQ